VHRIVTALAAEGLLERHAAQVRLGVRLVEIGQRVPRRCAWCWRASWSGSASAARSRRGLLARELAAIRESGTAYDQEEAGPGIVCAASPVLGPGGEIIDALSVSGWSTRIRLDHVASAVRTAALALSRALGYRAAE